MRESVHHLLADAQQASLEEASLARLRRQIAALEAEAKPLNTPHTYSKFAKLNRKIEPLRDDASALSQVVDMQRAKRVPIWLKLRAAQAACVLLTLYATYGLTLAPLPLGMRSFWFSNCTPFAWMLICHAVVRRFG